MGLDRTDLLAELDGISSLMHILSITASTSQEEIGSPTPDLMQGALFSVARQVERVTHDLYGLDHETAKEA